MGLREAEIANCGQGVREVNLCQTGFLKSISSYCSHSVRDRNLFQCSAACECRWFNRCHVRGIHGHRRKAYVTLKAACGNISCGASADAHLFQMRHSMKISDCGAEGQILTDLRHNDRLNRVVRIKVRSLCRFLTSQFFNVLKITNSCIAILHIARNVCIFQT